jgi:Fe-S-cluster containining protein
MPDGPLRRLIKAITRTLFLLERRTYRAYLRARGEERYVLGGECRSCAKCCEQPTLPLHPLIWYAPPLRTLFVMWQWYVNRFEYVRTDKDAHAFVFRCAHFDRDTRRCDSYESRPGICRDYPRFLLEQPWPELFEECGHRAVSKNADRLARALDQANLSPEQREKLKRRLHVLK